MVTVEREVDRYLTLIRNLVRSQGFTQLEIQEALGWGRSYISQLVTKQKALRVEQVLLILRVIGVDPREFFSELYRWHPGYSAAAGNDDFSELRRDIHGLANLLLEKQLISLEELSAAVGET